MKNKHLLDIVGEIDDRYVAEAAPAARKSQSKTVWLKMGAIAACMVLVLTVCFGSFAVVTEAKEYKAAVQFFNDYGLSTEGLSRGEIKEVYRDITTKSFTYAKTAEVISSNISSDHIGGYEIVQGNPTPEDIAKLWNLIISGDYIDVNKMGVYYKFRWEYAEDEDLRLTEHKRSYLEKYDGDNLLWSVFIPDFQIEDYNVVSDGIIAYGIAYTGSRTRVVRAWIAKIDLDGNLVWKKMHNNGVNDEYIASVLENADGSYAVISRGDRKYFCLSQYTADGKQSFFRKTEVGNYEIWNAVRFEDGYIVQLGSRMTNEHARIVKVDYEGNITESFSYGDEDSYYFVTDMIEFNENIYLSAYAVPRLADEDQSAGNRYDIAGVLNYLDDNNIWKISSEELTPIVRDNFTAMLLVCEPNVGKPQEYYSVKGSLGGKLSVGDTGNLLWNVESITETEYSPTTSAYSILGTSYVFRYTFDTSGMLLSQEKTDEIVFFWR